MPTTKVKTHSSLLWVRDPPRRNPRRESATHLATHDLAMTHTITWPTLEPMPKNTHHHELKRDVIRERNVDWIAMERKRVEGWEETPKREKELRFGIKKKKFGIWDYATVHSYIWDSTVADLQIFLDLQFWMLGGFWALMLNHPYISHLAVPMGML